MEVMTNLKKIYEIDHYLWLLETIQLLKDKKVNELDLENLIEELDDMGKEQKNAVKSLLEQIIRHLLLLQYWTEESNRNYAHWEAEIYSFRNQIQDRLTTNLKNYLAEETLNIYQRALGYVQRKTNHRVNFPQECPYTLEQLLDENYL